MKDNDILLFISRESATYHYTRRQVELACKNVFGKGKAPSFKIVEIEDDPALAEQYNIEALPTLIIGRKRYVGTPTQEMLSSCMGLVPPSRQ